MANALKQVNASVFQQARFGRVFICAASECSISDLKKKGSCRCGTTLNRIFEQDWLKVGQDW